MIYAKCLQRDELYNYYKMDESRQSVGVEAIHFLNPTPHISFTEYDRSKPGDCIEIEAISHHYPRISEGEYSDAYRRATAANFDLHLPR
jgi:hypothetical protein